MRQFKNYCLLIIFALLLIGCVDETKEKSPSKTNLTIASYTVSEKEKTLIQKTGVNHIEYFKLNGTLKEEHDLQFSIEVYENGQFKEELIKSYGGGNSIYDDTIISFGVTENGGEEQSSKFLVGIPSGLATTSYSNNMIAFAFTKLVDEEITLEKDKPTYIAGWLGNTKNILKSVGAENGELPEAVKEYELAFLYKVLWTDKEKE